MKFKFPLYHYQEDVLDVFHKEIERGDKKIHIVAPPGSGKTIMGLEMISRLKGNHLILVPNLTLQYQWKDKIQKFFLEEGENIEDIVSTTTQEIKKINIITYQSLTSSNNNNDLIMDQIIESWYQDIQGEFKNKSEFINYIEVLQDMDVESYVNSISKYKKRLKTGKHDNVENILSSKVLDYFERLENYGIDSILVDEAHHLTSWWSKVIYKLWERLGTNTKKTPFIIGLTATPPYDDIDFFVLDDDYVKLLGEVDYYIPTPAVVKSGRLAPWSDLVYFVEADTSIQKILNENDKKLNIYLDENKQSICEYLYKYLDENYDNQLKKSYNILINYIKFIKNFSNLDIQTYYFDERISAEITLEDIAKSIGKYIFHINIQASAKKQVKDIFYNLGYIYRGKNFYKFRTPIENMLIYSQSKIKGIQDILNKEISNQGYDLKAAIITDFLEEKEGIINCKYILKNLTEYKKYNPVLVSGRGIWKLNQDNQLIELDTNILEVTKQLETGEINIVIGTRGILGEGWDCPSLNTLIDLTGIVAYMSVNQVRGRAIRLNPNNLQKVANIYDIVTIAPGYNKGVDMYRIRRKHEKFYGVDDSGLIIRGVDHIYPNLEKHISNFQEINTNMLLRSENREFYYDLWGIGGKYENKEVFGLDIEINEIGKYIPFVNFRGYDSFNFYKLLNKDTTLNQLHGDRFYFILIKRYLNDFITNIVKTLVQNDILPEDFHFELVLTQTGVYKLISHYQDELIIKHFILMVSEIFSSTINQKYVCRYPFTVDTNESIEQVFLDLPLPDSLCKNKALRNSFKKEIENDKLYHKLLVNYIQILSYIIQASLFLLGFILYIKYLTVFIPSEMILMSTIVYIGILTSGVYFSKIETISSKKILQYKKIYFEFKNKKNRKFKPKFVYLKSPTVDKKYYIGKKTFLESKIEKIWM